MPSFPDRLELLDRETLRSVGGRALRGMLTGQVLPAAVMSLELRGPRSHRIYVISWDGPPLVPRIAQATVQQPRRRTLPEESP